MLNVCLGFSVVLLFYKKPLLLCYAQIPIYKYIGLKKKRLLITTGDAIPVNVLIIKRDKVMSCSLYAMNIYCFYSFDQSIYQKYVSKCLILKLILHTDNQISVPILLMIVLLLMRCNSSGCFDHKTGKSYEVPFVWREWCYAFFSRRKEFPSKNESSGGVNSFIFSFYIKLVLKLLLHIGSLFSVPILLMIAMPTIILTIIVTIKRLK